MIYVIGFLAQVCFSGRLLFQWIMSERAKQVVSPSIFWLLSLLGSYLLFFYGWLRHDFAIILGQLISYYIYIWNLDIKNNWRRIPRPIRYLLIATPFMAIGYMLNEAQVFVKQFFRNEDIPLWLLVWGYGTGDIHPALHLPMDVFAQTPRIIASAGLLGHQSDRLVHHRQLRLGTPRPRTDSRTIHRSYRLHPEYLDIKTPQKGVGIRGLINSFRAHCN